MFKNFLMAIILILFLIGVFVFFTACIFAATTVLLKWPVIGLIFAVALALFVGGTA